MTPPEYGLDPKAEYGLLQERIRAKRARIAARNKALLKEDLKRHPFGEDRVSKPTTSKASPTEQLPMKGKGQAQLPGARAKGLTQASDRAVQRPSVPKTSRNWRRSEKRRAARSVTDATRDGDGAAPASSTAAGKSVGAAARSGGGAAARSGGTTASSAPATSKAEGFAPLGPKYSKRGK